MKGIDKLLLMKLCIYLVIL